MPNSMLKEIDAILSKDSIGYSDYFIKIHIVDANLSELISREIRLKDISEFINESGYYMKEMNIGFRHYDKLMQTIFPTCTLDDMQNYQHGHTDFILHDKNNDEFYIELKYNGDKISFPQIKWNIQNKDKKIFYIFVEDVVFKGSSLIPKFIPRPRRRSIFSLEGGINNGGETIKEDSDD